jgi:hypothetical protein
VTGPGLVLQAVAATVAGTSPAVLQLAERRLRATGQLSRPELEVRRREVVVVLKDESTVPGPG